MDDTGSPEVGRAGSNHSPSLGRTTDNTNLTRPTLSDYSIQGNRRLILSGCGEPPIYEIFEVTSHFELITDRETARFGSLWDAICARGRLAERSAKP